MCTACACGTEDRAAEPVAVADADEKAGDELAGAAS
ncbi:hypothetical protein BJ981_006213 [Sphaerisporangium krabiense]|uniref:Uncharacterized protein n=1 Tax=Sphaerisporangium krabiense TaxID=763782 RepID=A0A7W8ZAF6_9ACTN|nr:hypothetical protein [Sphaerisporangium krabiense]